MEFIVEGMKWLKLNKKRWICVLSILKQAVLKMYRNSRRTEVGNGNSGLQGVRCRVGKADMPINACFRLLVVSGCSHTHNLIGRICSLFIPHAPTSKRLWGQGSWLLATTWWWGPLAEDSTYLCHQKRKRSQADAQPEAYL